MEERWISPQLSQNTEKSRQNRDNMFSGSVAMALVAIFILDIAAKDLLKVPTLLCFLILISTAFVVFIKDRSEIKNHDWREYIIKTIKAMGLSLFWILMINKLL